MSIRFEGDGEGAGAAREGGEGVMDMELSPNRFRTGVIILKAGEASTPIISFVATGTLCCNSEALLVGFVSVIHGFIPLRSNSGSK